MTTPDPKMVAALLRERAEYVERGATDRVQQVDKQLVAYGHTPDAPDVPEEKAAAAPKGRKSAAPDQTTS